ncbi:hypothetical protein HYH02_013520 [Chlamydomonas schloesseri]|uniref:Histone deacetylase domain-containing protein n=1 Tax=Chlamydomonas schloesseri TaxID=2026947 RepID=A0A835SPT5_9CHLO|nr:hypothetical protein HYH02_013520 [Chlamydomonas schloesseri]|eukprot:KAG2430988.1 hypothetical protein HYH02_013520 [Chlamydomonas schloesseri]
MRGVGGNSLRRTSRCLANVAQRAPFCSRPTHAVPWPRANAHGSSPAAAAASSSSSPDGATTSSSSSISSPGTHTASSSASPVLEIPTTVGPPPPAPGPGVMVAYYADHWKVPLPEGHRFPMLKYAATRSALAGDGSLEGRLALRPASPAALEDLALVHCPQYVERFRLDAMTEPEMRNVGFPWSPQLVGRTFSSCGGTVAATHLVLQQGWGIAGNIAGGTHHAFRDRGEGFCVFNDIAVASRVAIRDYGLDSILVLDLDVHQGNGTADIFADEPRVTTFDMFGDKNYPWKSRRVNTYGLPLPDHTGDDEYLGLLRSWLPRLLAQHRPQLIMFQAGVDALKGDSFGRLGLSRAGLLARNNLVYGSALEAGVPLVVTMGGGYTRPMDASVTCHTDVYRTAAYRLSAWAAAAEQRQQQQQQGTARGRAEEAGRGQSAEAAVAAAAAASGQQ